MKKILVLLFAVSFVIGLAGASNAAIYNGHDYQLITVSSGISWEAAADAAAGYGEGYYLATVTSAGENNFIRDMLGDGEYWLGGRQDTSANGEVWDWVNDEGRYWDNGPVTGMYQNWDPIYAEPNQWYGDGDRSEDYMAIWGMDRGDSYGYWNDEGGLGNITGFVVEKTAAPIPSAIFLLGSGCAALCGLRRRFNK